MTSHDATGPDTGPEHNVDKLRVGQVYAKAFLATADKTGQAEPLLEELGQVVDQVIVRFPQLERTLASPRLAVAEKLGILQRVLGSRVSQPLMRFLTVVCHHGRLDCLRQIRGEAQQMFDQQHRRVRVEVMTAAPLADELKERIRRSLETKLGRQVRLEAAVREQLIGGLVVRVGDTVFDGSVAHQLSQLRQEAVQRTVEQLRGNGQLMSVQ